MVDDTADTSGSSLPEFSPDGELPSDEILDALSDRRSRDVVRCLQMNDGTMTMADIAGEIAVWECEADVSNISSDEVKRIYISLYHAHVPKLASADVVEYSQVGDDVSLSMDADRLELVLEFAAD